MLKEVADQLALLKMIHATIDRMVENLTPEQWVQKPAPNMNNIASIVHHTALVEKRFLAVLAGQNPDVDAGAPFRAQSWDLEQIRKDWESVLPYAQEVLERLTEHDLDAFAAKLGVGEVNKRQLIAYTIAHTAHHRGQIPLVKKLIGAGT
ncbi:MAG: DinB family protein [Thermoflavifilum sp.]|nr:DinB family protein [Thermoflavifilum sp.]MCL6513887.1 DinB family protein [Alicyclobacillus sp.]